MSKILAEKYTFHAFSLYLFTNRRMREWSYSEIAFSDLLVLDEQVFKDTVARESEVKPMISSNRYFCIPFSYKRKL